MWTREQLKNRAKGAMKINYWKMVLVALLFSLLVGGSSGSNINLTERFSEDDGEINIWGDGEIRDDEDLWNDQDSWDEDEDFGWDDFEDELGFRPEHPDIDSEDVVIAVMIVLLAFFIALGIGLVIGFVFTAFLSNPLEMGCSRFFTKSLTESAEIRDVAYAFDHSYMNVVKVMFFRTLYTTLWTFLFIIPGIVKAYEYRMIPYLMAENPNLTKEQAFALSKQMMMGQKWSAFVLDWSFLGWELLSVCTFGILQIFYVGPYQHATNAALYEELSRMYGYPARNAYANASYAYTEGYANSYNQNVDSYSEYTAPESYEE